MRLKLIHTDKVFYGVDNYILPVVEMAAKYNLFIQIMCEILNTFDTFSEDIVNKVKKALEMSRYKVKKVDEAMLEDYEIFSARLESFYWNVVDTEFAKEAKKFDQDLYKKNKLYFPDCRLGRYRGLLLENLIDRLVRDRFLGKKYETGCQISVNGRVILTHYRKGNELHNKETIDIAGWDDSVQYGEFYECKANPKRFENQNYRYFMEIKKVMDTHNVSRYILALVSSEATRYLKAQKEYLEEQDATCNIDFELIGREQIFGIARYVIPEIA